jgi:hypothetical protein
MPGDQTDVSHARAFFRQAEHDLRYATLLRHAGEPAGSVLHCQHAVEKALKAVLYLLHGRDMFVRARPTHEEWATIQTSARGLTQALRRAGLEPGIVALEELLPPRPNVFDQRNSEYPYEPARAAAPVAPGDPGVFTPAEADQYLDTAQRLLDIVRARYQRLA